MMASAVMLALVLGMLIAGAFRGTDRERARIENAARADKLAVEVAQKRTLSSWIVAGKIALGAVSLASLALGVSVAGAYGLRKALTVGPNDAGLFPLLLGRIGGAWVVHDPNRAMGAVTSMGGAVQVQQLLAPGQLTVTTQAQMVQATAARYRHAPVILPGGRGNGSAAPGPAVDQVTDLAPVVNWPDKIPLRAIVDGPTTWRNMALGMTPDASGQLSPVTGSLCDLSHVLVGGASGWGKSSFLRVLVFQLAMSVDLVDLALVDLEGSCLAPFAQSDRLLYPIADNEQAALAIFQALLSEVERRKALYSQFVGVDRLDLYNEQAQAHDAEPLRPIGLIVDEATALLADKSVSKALRPLTLRSRKYGIFSTLAGQDLRGSSIDKAISNQLSTRLCFYVPSASQSRCVLLQSGAENLDKRGRLLARLPGEQTIEMQAPFLGYNEILAAMGGQAGPRAPSPSPITDVEPLPDDWAALWGYDWPTDHAILKGIYETATPDHRRAIIRRLFDLGKSGNQIQTTLFGYTGGKAHTDVSKAMEK